MKKLLLLIVLSLPAALFFTACDEAPGEETPTTITVPDNQNLTPTVLADETAPAAPVSFTTKAAWSSSVAESPAARSTRADGPDWISISPDHGDKAGNYSVTISLDVNTTGTDRQAVITILCDGEEIEITVTQKSTDKNGEVPKPTGNILTYDGNTYTVTKTEFAAGTTYILSEGVQTYRHIMKFYFDSGRHLEMAFVTDKQQFSGGAFKFGDTQINPLNKVTGLISFPAAAGGTGTADNLEWGHDLTAVRASDNTLTVEFGNVPTGLGKEASFKFVGPFNSSSNTDFVPVQNIAFPATSALSAGTAPLNTVCLLSHAMITPEYPTNSTIEWSVQNATLYNPSIEESRVTFDKVGTATVTATIRNGKLDDNGAQADYIQTWTVVVHATSNGSVTLNSTSYPIVKTEICAGVPHVTTDGVPTSSYRHDMKFYISSAQYVKLSFFTTGEMFSGGEFTMVSSYDASVINPVTGQFNFAVATGEVRDLVQCNTKVVTVRQSNNNFSVDFQGAYYVGGSGLSLHYEGEYKSIDNGGTEPTDPGDSDKVITFNGTEHPIVKTEFSTQTWSSEDGSSTVFKCQVMRFYINSARWVEVKFITNADEVATGEYVLGYNTVNVGKAQATFNFTTATGTTDYAADGGKVSVERNTDGTVRVEFGNVTTVAANLPVKLLYVGKFDEEATEPEKTSLGQMTASETSSTYSLTGCTVSFDYQTELMRVEFTGKDCDLWFETYVNHTEEGKAPLLNGIYTVEYLNAEGPNWSDRFNNKATSSRVHAISNHINWGDWSSGLREGTQIVVSMNGQKINASITNAHINGNVEYHGNMLINLTYDGVYTRK